jgi:PAS domain S-box-containing protein
MPGECLDILEHIDCLCFTHGLARSIILSTMSTADDIVATIFADREGIIREWNPAAEALFGFAAPEAIGQSLDVIIPEHLRDAHWKGYHRAIAAGRTRSGGKPMLTRAVHRDGSKLYIDVAFSVESDAKGQVLGASATARRSQRR